MTRSFVPKVVWSNLSDKVVIGGRLRPHSTEIECAAVSLRIIGWEGVSRRMLSGSTNLTNALSMKLHAFMAGLVNVAEMSGGDLIEIADSRLTFIWPVLGKSDSLMHAVVRAMKAALNLSQHSGDMSPYDDTCRETLLVSTACALSSGAVEMAVIGGVHGKFALVLDGPIFTELSGADKLSSASQTIVAGNTWAVSSEFAKGCLVEPPTPKALPRKTDPGAGENGSDGSGSDAEDAEEVAASGATAAAAGAAILTEVSDAAVSNAGSAEDGEGEGDDEDIMLSDDDLKKILGGFISDSCYELRKDTVKPAPAPVSKRSLVRQGSKLAQSVLQRRESVTAEKVKVGTRPMHAIAVELRPMRKKANSTGMMRFQPVFASMQDVVSKYGAHIERLSIRDDCLRVVLLFGVPGYVHNDDASRAVALALDLVQCVTRAGMDAAAGVHSGLGFSAVIDGRRCRHFHCLTETTTGAANISRCCRRLGGVVCSWATVVQADKSQFRFEDAPAVKGLAETETAKSFYQPARIVAQQTIRLVRAVGRDTEKRTLAGILYDFLEAGNSGPASILLSAPTGYGKSTLIYHALNIARQNGVAAYLGRASPIERSSPFSSLKDLLSRILDVNRSTVELEQQSLTSMFDTIETPEDMEVLFALLKHILRLEWDIGALNMAAADRPDAPRESKVRADLAAAAAAKATELKVDTTGTGDGAAAPNGSGGSNGALAGTAGSRTILADPVKLRRAIELLGNQIQSCLASGGQKLLIVEDLHYLDSSSKMLLKHIMTLEAPVLIIATSRDFAEGFTNHVRLADMGRTDAARVLSFAYGNNNWNEELLDFVLKQSNGNAFWIGELARMIAEEQPGFEKADIDLMINGPGGSLVSPSGLAGLPAGGFRPPAPRGGKGRPPVKLGKASGMGTSGQRSRGRRSSDANLGSLLEQCIIVRFNNLPVTQQSILRAAAVVGQIFSRTVIDALLLARDSDKAKVDQAMLMLVGKEFIQELHEGHYQWHHEILQELVYGRLRRLESFDLHLRCANEILREHDHDLRPFHSTIAYHYKMARYREEALLHYYQALQMALDLNAIPDAVRIVDECMDALLTTHDYDCVIGPLNAKIAQNQIVAANSANTNANASNAADGMTVVDLEASEPAPTTPSAAAANAEKAEANGAASNGAAAEPATPTSATSAKSLTLMEDLSRGTKGKLLTSTLAMLQAKRRRLEASPSSPSHGAGEPEMWRRKSSSISPGSPTDLRRASRRPASLRSFDELGRESSSKSFSAKVGERCTVS